MLYVHSEAMMLARLQTEIDRTCCVAWACENNISPADVEEVLRERKISPTVAAAMGYHLIVAGVPTAEWEKLRGAAGPPPALQRAEATLTFEELCKLLRHRCFMAGGATAWANKHGFDSRAVRSVLNDGRLPTPRLSAALGLRMTDGYFDIETGGRTPASAIKTRIECEIVEAGGIEHIAAAVGLTAKGLGRVLIGAAPICRVIAGYFGYEIHPVWELMQG